MAQHRQSLTNATGASTAPAPATASTSTHADSATTTATAMTTVPASTQPRALLPAPQPRGVPQAGTLTDTATITASNVTPSDADDSATATVL